MRGVPITKPKLNAWLLIPLVNTEKLPLNQQCQDLCKYVVFLQIWGEGMSLMKLHSWIHAHWFGTLFIQGIFENMFILVLDSVEAKNKVLESDFVWFGRNLILIFPWHPLYQPNANLSKFLPVWFSMPGIPLEFTDPYILSLIGNSFGKFLLSNCLISNGILNVRKCVLVNSEKNMPRCCNIKSLDGIWRQPLIKDSKWFQKSTIELDAPLFKRIKVSSSNLGGCSKDTSITKGANSMENFKNHKDLETNKHFPEERLENPIGLSKIPLVNKGTSPNPDICFWDNLGASYSSILTKIKNDNLLAKKDNLIGEPLGNSIGGPEISLPEMSISLTKKLFVFLDIKVQPPVKLNHKNKDLLDNYLNLSKTRNIEKCVSYGEGIYVFNPFDIISSENGIDLTPRSESHFPSSKMVVFVKVPRSSPLKMGHKLKNTKGNSLGIPQSKENKDTPIPKFGHGSTIGNFVSPSPVASPKPH